MSISFVTGKPGGGKGLKTMHEAIEELVKGKRHIITNLAIRVDPWIFGDGQPMMGLKAYMNKTYGKDYDCAQRIHILPDNEIAAFYLWRVVNGKLVKSNADIQKTKDGEERVMGFDTTNASLSGGTLYIVDEAWQFYSSRNWQQTGEGMLFYGAQHRKFGDDVLICTQHTGQIDKAIQRVAQDFWLVRNHSKLSIGLFRQPDVFTVQIYESAPTGTQQKPMSTKVFTLDKKGLAQTYDTSSGVGLRGSFAADVGARKKGIAFKWLIVSLIVIIILIMVVLHFGPAQVTHFLLRNMPKTDKFAASTNTPSQLPPPTPQHMSPPAAKETAKQEVKQIELGHSIEETNSIYCVGYSGLFGEWVCYFSDGSTAYANEGEVQEVRGHWVVCWGKKYRVALPVQANVAPGNNYQTVIANTGQGQQTVTYNADSYVPQGTVQVLPPIHDHFTDLPSPQPLNGIATLQSGAQRQSLQSTGGVQ